MELMMTPDQVTLVQESFAKVAPISDTAAVLFYDRLFEVAPSVKSMFPADMTEQRKKLMATLAFVVNGLANLESILPAASALATRHVSYGARKEHYPVVGAALLWTLEKGLGDGPRLAYNRVLLSSVLAGETASHDIELRPASWWSDRGVFLFNDTATTE